jgi:murein DD-endopeptidase MepM/ murein hydrolase activator NlpD
MAVGDGVVTFAAPRGPSGNMVTLKHGSSYQTLYKHLSRFAVKPGDRVKMGELIGYVGATGLATGPHLHFEFHEGGRVVDPERLEFPAATALAARDRKSFTEAAKTQLAELPSWSQTMLTSSERMDRKKMKIQ